MTSTTHNDTLANISRYIEKQVDNEKLNVIIAQLQKLDLLISTIKEALFAYALLNPSVISDAFYKQLQTRLLKPKRQLLKFISKKRTKYNTPEDKEVDYILSLIEDEDYHDIHDLQSSLEEYFFDGGRNNLHKKNVIDFIIAALNAYYERILKPEVDYHIDLNRKKLALLTCVDKAVNFFITNRGRDYLEPSNVIKTRIQYIPTEHELLEFVDAWLDKRKTSNNQNIENLTTFKNKLPKRLKSYLDREFNQYRNKNITFGEFFVNEKTTFTFADFILFAIDKYIDEAGNVIKPTNLQTIDEIKVILKNPDLTDDQMIKNIRKLLKKKRVIPFFSNRLSRYCSESIGVYNKIKQTLIRKQNKLKKQGKPTGNFLKQGNLIQIPQIFITKQVRPLDVISSTPNNSDKILILVHGWRDNKIVLAKLTEEARKKGYLVISYYQKSLIHNINFFKRIQLNALRRNFRFFMSHMLQAYPNARFAIYGQSISADIPLCEKTFIQQQAPIKSVILDSPAIANTKIFSRSMSLIKKLGTKSYQTHGIKKFLFKPSRVSDISSASSLKVFCSIPTLLRIMRHARFSLSQLITSKQSQMNVKWHFIFSQQDNPANIKTIETFRKKLTEQIQPLSISIELLPQSSHTLADESQIQELIKTLLSKIPNSEL